MRDTGITASACATSVYVNGEVAAYVRSGEKVTLNIPAGDVILGVQPDGVCGLGGGLVELEAKVQPGRLMHYRIGYDQSGSVGLYRTIER